MSAAAPVTRGQRTQPLGGKVFIRLFPVLLVCAVLLRTQQVTQAQDPAAESQTTPSLTLHDGTPLFLRNVQSLSSEKAHAGDEVLFEVIRPVTVDGWSVIADRATATGKVASVERE